MSKKNSKISKHCEIISQGASTHTRHGLGAGQSCENNLQIIRNSCARTQKSHTHIIIICVGERGENARIEREGGGKKGGVGFI